MNDFKTRNPRRLVGLILAVSLVAAACSASGEATTGETDEAVTTTTESVVTTTTVAATTTTTTAPATTTTTTAPEGSKADFYDLVTVNGAQLAYSCEGSGSPKVIIEHGLYTLPFQAEPSEHWYAWIGAQLGIAEFTEVCVFGRRGVAGSDPVEEGTTRTADDQVADLVAFLDRMSFTEPVVIAGHSWGGAIGQLFANQYPDRTAALVLIDSVNADSFGDSPPSSSGPIEFVDLASGSKQLAAIGDLDALPITVLSAGTPLFTVLGTPDGAIPAATPYHDPESFEAWTSQQKDLAGLSSNIVHTTLDDSGHLMQVDRPDAITDAVREIIERIG
ncbi:MAG: alpha/beta fold hydrolase [Gammaproteobacteria bacterium]|nr:alpha/beta fold hydrolase [Gammaproteobacteria bacterium]